MSEPHDLLVDQIPEEGVIYLPTLKYIGATIEVKEMSRLCIIPAGTMFLIPYAEGYESKLPEFTVIMGGQRLQRDMYPDLSNLFADTGGFYEFQLPNLEGKFFLGFDENGNRMMASGAIFYETVPQQLFQARDIRR